MTERGKELSENTPEFFKERVRESLISRETTKLKEAMIDLTSYMFERAVGEKWVGAIPIGELDIDNQGLDTFSLEELDNTGFNFMGGTCGQRIFFRRDIKNKSLKMYYPKPDESSWFFGGKYWEIYMSLFGSESVDFGEEL